VALLMQEATFRWDHNLAIGAGCPLSSEQKMFALKQGGSHPLFGRPLGGQCQ
jgi:hypothetical protein